MSFWRNRIIQPSLDRDVEDAVAEQRAILERDPSNPQAHLALGALFHLKGQTDPAIECFQKAIELDPAFAGPHVSLGRVYAVRGQYEAAWKHAREAARLGDRSLVEQLERYPKAK